jgi:DNA helicase-2/ATP-dependent DNA helicase PcrA
MQLNMYAIISITNDDIKYAEKILFGKENIFDDERKVFIKNLETIDLQAVPGSGKTTALLAKLLIFEKYLPFEDGSGILVLSHTNAAVDEIKNRIGKYCPKLFSYPNFVGTIQNFVDTFLAIPFYINKFKTKPFRIDNEIYDEQVERFYNTTNNVGLKNYLDRQIDGLSFLKSIRITTQGKLKSYINGTPENFKLKDSSKPTYKALVKFKIDLLRKGYLHFDDAYTLADFQLSTVPHTKILLQKRFKYVFVDEMQDIDKHQYNLLEEIFYDNGNSESVYQRIGDKNQAIYDNRVKLDDIWHQRNIQYIQGSHRLSPNIANIVERLALTPNEIIGLNKNEDNTPINIKPHIIVFDDDTINQVISKFAEIIEHLQAENKIPKQPKHKFMAIGWIKEPTDEGRIAISSYWKDLSVIGYKKQIDFKVLKDYLLLLDNEKKTLESVRKNILNAFLKIMRLENILDENNRMYSKRKFLQLLKERFPTEYEELKLYIYKWSIAIVKGKSEDVFESVKNYIPTFLQFFGKEIENSNDFINSESDINIENIEIIEQTNIYKSDNIEIKIGTIHSAKGQTHTATLYLETFYQGKYESEYLKEIFLGNDFNPNRKYKKQATKMAYVGFSRPTHLLCVAIHKDRFDRDLSRINNDIWKVVELE